MNAAELLNVTKRFGPATALDDVSLSVAPGSVTALLGPNGAGKSTAIALLLGLRRPDRGAALLFGRNPTDRAARNVLGAMLQETAFPATLRVRELIALVRRHYSTPLPATAILARFGLESLASRQVGGLSVGERRRVGVALAFAGNPMLVVLDEPTTGLDGEARRAVWGAIRDQCERGGAALICTHHLEEADALADRVIQIERGRVVIQGAVRELKAGAGRTVVRFRVGAGAVPAGAVREGSFALLFVTDPAGTIDNLIGAGLALEDLEVRPLTLAEALSSREVPS